MEIVDSEMSQADVCCQCAHILDSCPDTTSPPPSSISLLKLKQQQQQSAHNKEELQHLSLALAAFTVHPVRISRNLEPCDNKEHQMGPMSFPSTAAGNTRGCIEGMWSCLVEITSRSDLTLYNRLQPELLAHLRISWSTENEWFRSFLSVVLENELLKFQAATDYFINEQFSSQVSEKRSKNYLKMTVATNFLSIDELIPPKFSSS